MYSRSNLKIQIVDKTGLDKPKVDETAEDETAVDEIGSSGRTMPN